MIVGAATDVHDEPHAKGREAHGWRGPERQTRPPRIALAAFALGTGHCAGANRQSSNCSERANHAS
jgi:hypothetical protein